METADVSQEQAAAALATIEAWRERVLATAGRFHLGKVVGVVTPIIVYGAKDLVPDRRARWVLTVGWRLASYAVIALRFRQIRVWPTPSGPRKPSARAFVVSGLAAAGVLTLQRLVVHGLRRTRLRYPNVVAGFALAALDAGHQHFLLRRIWRPGEPADYTQLPEAEPEPRLQAGLLSPTALKLWALLSAGLLEVTLLREWLGLSQTEMDQELQALLEPRFAAQLDALGKSQIMLTKEGREHFAQHVQALRQISTGDTPR